MLGELKQLQEHLTALIMSLQEQQEGSRAKDEPPITNECMETYVAHLYRHLNHAWNGRNLLARAGLDQSLAEYVNLSRFPTDLDEHMPFHQSDEKE